MLTDEIKKIIRDHSSSPMTGLVEAVEQTRQNALAAEIQELIETYGDRIGRISDLGKICELPNHS